MSNQGHQEHEAEDRRKPVRSRLSAVLRDFIHIMNRTDSRCKRRFEPAPVGTGFHPFEVIRHAALLTGEEPIETPGCALCLTRFSEYALFVEPACDAGHLRCKGDASAS